MDKQKLWHLYTAQAEYESSFKDIFERNVVQLSRPGNLLDAELSEYLTQIGFNPSYPNNKAFACCISHDIDFLYPNSWGKELIKAGIKGAGKRMGEALKNIFSPGFDSHNDLAHLFELEKSHGIPASYYFLSIEADDPEDFNYRVSELGPYLEEINKIGGEVGLHGSKWAYNDAEILSIELNRLKEMHPNIIGYRNHYLKFELPKTWNILAEAGFRYDTSFGDPRSPGFRNGICYPFQPFDLKTQSWINIYEIPLIAMDVSFFNHLKLDYERAFKLFTTLVEKVKSYKGVFSFLWHNNYMQGDDRIFYEKCLNYLHKENAHFTTGRDLIEWWESKGYFQEQKELLQSLIPTISH